MTIDQFKSIIENHADFNFTIIEDTSPEVYNILQARFQESANDNIYEFLSVGKHEVIVRLYDFTDSLVDEIKYLRNNLINFSNNYDTNN